jgi:hypothetical protein
MARVLINLSVLLMLASGIVHADTDVIVFENGDRLTGEIKSMERGRLRFKTDATGTIDIQWDKVAFIGSDQNIQVEMISGVRHFGHVKMDEDEFTVLVETGGGPVELENSRIAKMNPIDQTGIRDIDIDISAGYNFTKASDVQQFNFAINGDYRTRERIISANFSSLFSNSDSNEKSQRQLLGLNYTRLRSNRWLNDGSLRFEQNDELDLNLRTSLGSGIGRILKQSNRALLVVRAGLQVTRENIVGEPEDVDSLESYFSGKLDWFRYDSPELNWSTNLEVIPSLTESGRVRVEFDTNLKWEIVGDLFWMLEFYSSYDSQPQSETGSNNDHGVITSVSYDF